ncbi:ABC transporter substrate-binding protein [Frankia canadensis]|nr:ABC transporter substrate-binding protein [Frankia canadensis]
MRGTAMVAAAAALAVAVAACGSDGKGNDDATGKATQAKAALTKSEIRLGLLAATTGATSSADVPAVGVANAWADWVNVNGGINGHPVTIVVKDTKGDIATGTAAAKAFLDDPSILSITSASSNTEPAIATTLKGKDIAVVGAYGYQPTIWGAQENVFPLTAPAVPNILAQFASAKANGAKNWAVASCVETAACKQASVFYGPASKLFDVKVVGSYDVAVSAPSYTAECLKMINTKTDFLQLSFPPAAAARLIDDCDSQGYKGLYGASGGAVTKALLDVDGVRLSGGVQGFPWWSTAKPVTDYRQAVETYSKGADPQTAASTSTWAALQTIRAALAHVGDKPARADVFTGLYGLKNFDLGGLLAQPVTFTKGKIPAGIDCLWLYKYENGKFTTTPLAGTKSGNSVTSGDLQSTCLKLQA